MKILDVHSDHGRNASEAIDHGGNECSVTEP
jgi:hypothetical protein